MITQNKFSIFTRWHKNQYSTGVHFMKKIFPLIFILLLVFPSCDTAKIESISFYQVPLACGAAPEIGCGSRIKPLFIATEKEKQIKESWTNRQGTVIAIVWSGEANERLMETFFMKNDIDAKLISDTAEVRYISADFRVKGKWLMGMEVDKLSIEEAGVIADSAVMFAQQAGLINAQEALVIKTEIEELMKKELVQVRTFKQLSSIDTEMKWKQKGYEVYVKHIGVERAEKVRNFFMDYKNKQQLQTSPPSTSAITCPHCGFTKEETLPTDACQLAYDCAKCKKKILAKEGDCCVFCSYGSAKCPSKQ